MRQFKSLAILLLLSVVAPLAALADSFKVIQDDLVLGESATLQFVLKNTQEFYGFQAEVKLPDGLEALKSGGDLEITLSNRADGGDYRVNSNTLSNGNLIMGAFSANHKPFTENDGVLVNLNVKVSENFKGGAVEVSNIYFIDANNKDVEFGSSSTTLGVAATGITLSETAAELKVGESVTLIATIAPESATDKTVTWTSDKEAVATVDASGKVTAKALGEATITATCGTVTATCKVNVVPTPVESITLSSTALTLFVGENATLTATVAPEDATDKTVIWTSSNEAVATVSKEGVVTAVAKGTVTITATAGDKKAECSVTVKKAVESVTLDKTDATVKVGDVITLKATVNPTDASDKTVTWTSSDANVATVDATGKVTAVAPGEAVITATAGDKKTATCKVTVKNAVASVTLDQTEATVKVGDTVILKATVEPENAIVSTVTWTSSNSKVATVDATGKVTAVAAGEAVITATAGDKSATCKVTVKKAVESVSFKRHEVTIETGKTLTLVATITPDDAIVTTATWTSSDTKVATVEGGKITAVAAGTAVITATADGKSDSCTVTVKSSVSKVTIDPTEASIEKGKTLQLKATVSPEDAIDTTVIWTTSNSKVATVDATGMVTAVDGGSATITATSNANATVKAACKVTVTVPVTGLEVQDEEHKPLESGVVIPIYTGNTYDLTGVVLPANATDRTVTWTSSKEEVATVDNAGLISTHKAGEAVITASIAGFTFTAKVVVTDATVPVTGVTIDKTKADMKTGETMQLTATVTPEDADNKEVSWSSSDKSIATVTKGLVKALKAGTVIITANAGGIKASCEITITDIEVTSVKLDKTKIDDLMEGETVTLTAVVGPEDATDKTVIWTSSDENIATVDEEGDVTAVAPGTVTITATAGKVSATCEITVTAKPVAVEDIELKRTQITLVEGGTVTLIATVHPDDATDKTVTWTSSDEKVATVDGGVVTAIAVGEAVITAKAGDATATCKIIVKKAVAGVTLDQTEATIVKGETLTLEATVVPEDAIETDVVWSSSDEKVATVDQIGVVTAVNGGTAVITVKVGDKSAECKVTVTVPVTSLVVLDEDENPIEEGTVIEFHTGHEYNLTAVVGPDDATDKTVTWTTSDDTVIGFLDNEGLLDGLKAGEATVTASIADFSVTVKVKVTDPVIPVTGIKLDKTTAEMETGKTLQLTATLEPENATSKDITWTSSDKTIATVDTKGLVKALKAGKVKVTATANKFFDTCEITIKDPIIAVDGITLSETEATLTEGETLTLTATVTPDNATDATVTWTSSNEAVATISKEGVVTAVAAGEAVINAKAGEKTATCVITVEAAVIEVDGITISETEATLTEGETLTLTATVTPADATDATVTWTSSNEAVATVKDGVVTAIAEGEAIITAKAGEKTATCKITVEAAVIEVETITLSQTEARIVVGDCLTLTATVTPDNATDKTVTWTSSDEYIASVDEYGVVTGLSLGEATITATAGDVTATCVVTVTRTSAVELIGFDPEAPVKVFDLNGAYVSDTMEGLRQGTYVVRQGNAAKKVIIR